MFDVGATNRIERSGKGIGATFARQNHSIQYNYPNTHYLRNLIFVFFLLLVIVIRELRDCS